MNFQIIVVIIIVAFAIFYVAKTIYKNTQAHSCESGDCKHVKKTVKKV